MLNGTPYIANILAYLATNFLTSISPDSTLWWTVYDELHFTKHLKDRHKKEILTNADSRHPSKISLLYADSEKQRRAGGTGYMEASHVSPATANLKGNQRDFFWEKYKWAWQRCFTVCLKGKAYRSVFAASRSYLWLVRMQWQRKLWHAGCLRSLQTTNRSGDWSLFCTYHWQGI